jgi:hypothetical protein
MRSLLLFKKVTILIVSISLLSSILSFELIHLDSEIPTGSALISTTLTEKWNETDDIIFIHHSCGSNWLKDGLHKALLAKSYIDERNDIDYDTVVSNDSGRPSSLGSEPGDNTNMNHWILWFNDYLDNLKTFRCSDGENRIIMFKSCFPISNILSNGTEPGSPFSSTRTISNYKAVYRYFNNTNGKYTRNSINYKPLEQIFAENPDFLFIPVTAPPRHYGPNDATNDIQARRARQFNNWLKKDWLNDYNERNPGLHNVAVYDWFDNLSYPNNHSSHPNRLKKEFGGNNGDSHPNTMANKASTVDFSTGTENFIDKAWRMFNSTSSPHQWPMEGGDDGRSGKISENVTIPVGRKYWNFSSGGEITGSPNIDEHGTIHFGSNDSKFYAIFPNGTLKWSYTSGGRITRSPALGQGGRIYFGANDNKIYALERNGSLRWNKTLDSSINSSLVIDKSSRILLTTVNGYVRSLHQNGSEAWNHSTEHDHLSSPAIGPEGDIYIGAGNGSVIKLDDSGSLQWNNTVGSGKMFDPSVDEDGNIFIGSDNGFLYSLYPNSTLRWSYKVGYNVICSPSLDDDGRIIFGSDNGKLYSLHSNGTLDWTYHTRGGIITKPIIDNTSNIIFGSLDGKVYCISKNGTKNWDVDTGYPIKSSPAMDTEGNVYIGSDSNSLYSIGKSHPDRPTNLTYRNGSGWIELSWTAPIDNGGMPITNYSIYRKIGQGSLDLIGWTSNSGTSYNDTNITVENTFNYFVKAHNMKGYSALSNTLKVDMMRPIFLRDGSDTEAYTGNDFHFMVRCKDDSTSTDLITEYWFGTGSHTKMTMSGSENYSLTISIPSNSTSTLHYIFHAKDKYGNRNQTPQKNVTVQDDDNPKIWSDSTPSFGTTGDSIVFSINVTDNIEVKNVFVEYWQGNGAHNNITMMGSSNSYSVSVNLPSDSTSNISYFFSASDSSGKWARSQESSITVLDDEIPILGIDSTQKTGTTGDSLTFSIQVSDNIAVSSVYVEYWQEPKSPKNSTMSETSGNYTLTITVPSNSTLSISYRFVAVDDSDNWAISKSSSVKILDDDKPEIINDYTSNSITTGENITFMAEVNDNIGIGGAHVDYWFVTGQNTNSTMVGSNGIYSFMTSVPSNSTKALRYFFCFFDLTGNWQRTQTRTVEIIDNDKPVFGTDFTPTSATTGEAVSISISIKDNIDVKISNVEYWFGNGSHVNSTMVSNNSVFSHTIQIPANSTDTLFYLIRSCDNEGNWAISPVSSIMILDNDKPSLIEDLTSKNPTTGERFSFIVSMEDNIGIKDIWPNFLRCHKI